MDKKYLKEETEVREIIAPYIKKLEIFCRDNLPNAGFSNLLYKIYCSSL